jgi:hypothetical protein
MLMRQLRTAAATFALWAFYVPLAHAQDLGKGTLDAVAGQASIKSTSTLPQIIGSLIKVFTGALGLIFLLLTVYAGFLYLTAAGDEDKVKHAKETLQRGVIGLLILAAAYALTVFVINALTKSVSPTGA